MFSVQCSEQTRFIHLRTRKTPAGDDVLERDWISIWIRFWPGFNKSVTSNSPTESSHRPIFLPLNMQQVSTGKPANSKVTWECSSRLVGWLNVRENVIGPVFSGSVWTNDSQFNSLRFTFAAAASLPMRHMALRLIRCDFGNSFMAKK